MRTIASCVWLLALGCAASGGPGAPDSRPSKPLTLERLLSGPSITGSAPSAPAWSPDSRRLAFRWSRDGGPSGIWLVEADGTQLRQLTTDSPRDFVWLPDSSGLLYLRGRELRHADLTGETRPLATFGGSAGSLEVSPNGRFASILQDGDLWLFDRESRQLEQATEVGVEPISALPLGRYRRRDVEIGSYVWGGPRYAWSPDSRTIAVHHVDRRNVRTVPFPDYLGEETEPNPVRRSYPGDANEARRVGLLDVSSRKLTMLELPGPTENRVIDFGWSKHGSLLIDRESDTAVDRWLHVVDPTDSEPRLLWHDHRESRVYTTTGSTWHADGRHVLMLGDLDDRYGLYALSLESSGPRLLSNPDYDVTGGPIATAAGTVFYPSNEPSPYEQHVFCAGLDGAPPTRLTTRPGQMRPYPSPDGQRLALLHSSDSQPTELYLVDATGRHEERRVTHSTPPEFDEHPWAQARYLTFPSRADGRTIHARMLVPANFDPSRRYPVLFGPVYSNTVRNRWGGFYANFQQLLVAKGYLVVQVDVRGSTGYGREFREGFLMDFAGRDLDDLESAVKHLESQSYVDPERIGIWGSSYGGTLTVYALLKKPGLFDAGVACASAVAPNFFGSDDVAIVRRPGSHPEAFERGAAQYAANLEDPLLLIHGMQDQVVPFKTVVELAEELMRQGKDFDFAFAPRATHGWTRSPHYARYLLGKLLAHFDRHLAPR